MINRSLFIFSGELDLLSLVSCSAKQDKVFDFTAREVLDEVR